MCMKLALLAFRINIEIIYWSFSNFSASKFSKRKKFIFTVLLSNAFKKIWKFNRITFTFNIGQNPSIHLLLLLPFNHSQMVLFPNFLLTFHVLCTSAMSFFCISLTWLPFTKNFFYVFIQMESFEQEVTVNSCCVCVLHIWSTNSDGAIDLMKRVFVIVKSTQ